MDYKQLYKDIEKQLTDYLGQPHMIVDLDKIAKYAKALYHIDQLDKKQRGFGETPRQERKQIDYSTKSDFSSLFAEKMEINPDKALSEVETFINMMKALHSDRYNSFIARLKEIR